MIHNKTIVSRHRPIIWFDTAMGQAGVGVKRKDIRVKGHRIWVGRVGLRVELKHLYVREVFIFTLY